MKKTIVFLVALLSISYASALSCTDLPKVVVRYQEDASVLALQKFLFEKGHLKATPNGYFGNGTFAAVKAYQKSLGLEQVGAAGPMTRAAIKKDSCGVQPSSSVGVVAPVVVKTPAPPVVSFFPNTLQGNRNAKRKEDAEIILKALYRYFVDSRGVNATLLIDNPVELCTVNPAALVGKTATSGDSFTLVTPKSPCADVADISYLVPNYVKAVPRDPSIATSSALTGYTITRSQFNDITIASKNPEDGAIIKMTCNFSGFCKDVKYVSKEVVGTPEITNINRNVFLRDATPKTPLIIKGKNFTKKNKIKVFSLYNSKEYDLGELIAKNDTATTTSLSIETAIFAKEFSCGNNCFQKLPLGDYMLSIENEGGTSNTTRVALRGFTTTTMSTQVNGSIIPTTKNVRVGTITLSSSIPVSLKLLTLTSTSTSKNLASKISNFVLKDVSSGTTYAGGSTGSFSLGAIGMFENESRVYDVYIDTIEVMNSDAGFITYGGKLLLTDMFSSTDIEVPIKEFSFTVSH